MFKSMVEKILASMTLDMLLDLSNCVLQNFLPADVRAYLYIEKVTPGEQGKWEELGPEDIRYTILYRSDDGYVHGPWREGYPSDVLIKHMQVHWRSPVSLDEDGFGYESGVLVQEKIDFAKRIVHYGVEEQKRWQQFIDEKKNKKPSWPMPRRRW
tara:strand:- start:691 stop:1155 length:465 start_codon:yes stop_codon:yes gene_type:complete